MSNERKRQRQNRRQHIDDPTTQATDPKTEAPPLGTLPKGLQSDSGDAASSGAGFGRWVVAAGVALAISAGAFFMVSNGGGSVRDVITEAETQARDSAHKALLAGPGLPVKLVGSDEVDDALASMPDTVSEETREEIRERINQDGLQLAWVTLWDTHAEDGDILRFESSSSIPIEVMALNARTTIAIPYPADGKVLVTGVTDGGGGITIALESGATSISWPTMAEGDQLFLPITPGF
ncbi:hypothetical protein [Ruegeria sp. HKCCD7318]|uniref:hypothetical protein n=1 Tax=Ruegeria sp. HKCCD7318 TaxID=2683014 RepID=UPI001490A194|nr:hypothetical protein [Ruegeria sp. HKCCD7318]NOE36212.1 hypothetical protein [Ruegeria sp. HKCCD7318]